MLGYHHISILSFKLPLTFIFFLVLRILQFGNQMRAKTDRDASLNYINKSFLLAFHSKIKVPHSVMAAPQDDSGARQVDASFRRE